MGACSICYRNARSHNGGTPPADARPVPGFPDLVADSHGIIWRAGWTTVPSGKTRRFRNYEGLREKRGYKRITHGGKPYQQHRLVQLAWEGEPPDFGGKRAVVNHINGVKNDNRPENLEWTTDAGNMEHARKVLKVGGTAALDRMKARARAAEARADAALRIIEDWINERCGGNGEQLEAYVGRVNEQMEAARIRHLAREATLKQIREERARR